MNMTLAALSPDHDLDAVVTAARARASEATPLGNLFVDAATQRPRFALGRNAQSEELIRFGMIDGVVDDFVILARDVPRGGRPPNLRPSGGRD